MMAPSVAALHAVALAEAWDDEEILDCRLAWSYALAAQQSQRRKDTPHDDSTRAIDLLLTDPQ
jgi:hypothetical protein